MLQTLPSKITPRETHGRVGFAAVLDAAIGTLLLVLLAFMPLALGVVQAWSEWISIVLAAGIALCLAVRLVLAGPKPSSKQWAYWPMVAFILIAVLQLVPLPAALVGIVSPRTRSMRIELLGDLPNAPAALNFITLSFYPYATRHALRIVLLAVVVFAAVSVVFRSPGRIRLLLGAISILGAALAALALAQDMSHAGGIYWRIPIDSTLWSGTFVNHSDFGQHMNLCIGAALGLLLAVVKEKPVRDRSAWQTSRRLLLIVFLIATIACGVCAIFLSRTRGGIVAMLASGTVVVLFLVVRGGWRGLAWTALLVACFGLAASMFVGFDKIYDRLATLRNSREYHHRLTTLGDLRAVWEQFSLLGTGLGTHETFYPRFQTTQTFKLSTHADDEYAEVAEETGAAGLICVLAFVGIVWWNLGRSVMRGSPAICFAAVGLGYGLLSVQLHSLSDFGQHLPAIGCLSAVVCALAINLGRLSKQPAKGRIEGVFRGRPTRWALAPVMVTIAAWAIVGAEGARRAEASSERAEAMASVLRSRNWDGTGNEYADLVRTASAASDADPGNVDNRYWSDVYQWHAAASPARSSGPSNPEIAAAYRKSEARRIASDLSAGRLLCPTFGSLYTYLGQLELYELGDSLGALHLRTAATLAPHDSIACFAAGELDAEDGHWEDARRNFRHVLIVDGSQADAIFDLYVNRLKRPDQVVQVADDDPQWLLMLSQRLSQKGLAAEAKDKAIVALERRTESFYCQADELGLLAQLYAERGDDAAAAASLQRALAMRPRQVEWHLARAQSLGRLGRTSEARAEVTSCLTLQPGMPEALDLLRTLNVKSK